MPNDLDLRAIWLAIAIIFSLFVAVGAGVLARVGGAHVSRSVATAGTAFAGTVLLILATYSYVWH